MIFLSVGAQMPFDRLVRLVDEWAASRGRDDVVGQIGPSSYRPSCIRLESFLPPAVFREHVQRATAVVAHAGMGTILTALEYHKPLLVFPRLARLGETRNDHQVATARVFAEQGKVLAAYDREELFAGLDEIERFEPGEAISSVASSGLLTRLREFVQERAEPPR